MDAVAYACYELYQSKFDVGTFFQYFEELCDICTVQDLPDLVEYVTDMHKRTPAVVER